MKKRLFYLLGFILLLLMVLAFLLLSLKEPPLQEITQARKSLAEAENIYSSRYSSVLYENAKKDYDSAMNEWKNENKRFILLRDYKRVKEKAEQANKLAQKAISETNSKISKAEVNLGILISQIEELIQEFDKKYNNFPFNSKNSNDLVKSKLLYNEGTLAYKQANYLLCEVKLDSAKELISKLHEINNDRLEDYFLHYSEWKKLVDQSISYSKKHNTSCIIVDKMARECVLYKNGKVLLSWEIELGVNWVGDKNRQGDKSTPEGLYKVVAKKSNGNSRYHKALLLNYPNEDDNKRFLLNKKNGIIDKDAKIGNMIEIHGNGGNGIDWTDGCVALRDSDMDKLFAACQIGTNVTIVGSVRPLNELFSNEQ